MATKQRGFTLIELVTVIVILGILAAVAVPQFTNLSTSAKTAVAQAACGTLQSTAIMLYASNRSSASYSTITAGITLSANTGSYAGTCGAPTFTPSGTGSVATTCTALSATFCT